MNEVTFTIDDQPVTAPRGQRILWAAEAAGIYIPHLCAHPLMRTPSGACRLCWVEIEGRPTPVTACTEPVEPGLVIRTRGQALKHRFVQERSWQQTSAFRADEKENSMRRMNF